ncbi:hypothetical protein N806_29755 [Rhodococcus sp. P27]|nr:hypothetical protein N806_29755 [Rhodococcus sp. P27]
MNELEPLMSDIRKAAKFIEYQWPGVMDAEDAEQSIILRLLETPGSIRKITRMDSKPKYRAIVGIGNQLASAERADFDYFKGSYRYNVDEVKRVLKLGVLTDDIEGWDEAVHDLIEALVVLVDKTPQYADAILSRYADDVIPTINAEKMLLKHGLTVLTTLMNKSHKRRFSERDEGPGSRPVITNESARKQSGNDWDGED